MAITRRQFLVQTALSATAAGLSSHLLADTRTPEQGFPLPCASHSWTKHGVVLRADQPWEDNHIQAFNSSIEHVEGDRWRIWYGATTTDRPLAIAYAEGVPGEPMVKHQAVLSSGKPADAPFAIGNLPAGWVLASPTHIRLPDGRHRLYFFAYGRQAGHDVQRYLAADSDDGRRYRVLDPLRPSLYTFWDTTPDKQFLAGQKLEDIVTNDGATVYLLPDGTFELYAQSLETIPESDPRYIAHDNIKGYVRFIDRLTSEDGVRFDHRDRKVLEPDESDPVDTQFYHHTVTHTPRGRVGLLGWYRVDGGTTDLHYAHSTDGVHWNRTREPWLARGEAGEPDSQAIYPPNSMVYYDNKWWLFYTGVNYTHSAIETPKAGETPCSCIMLATTESLWSS